MDEPLNIQRLAEDFDLEAKKAAGQHGLGELPRDFWPTYSAMANTSGGVVLLVQDGFLDSDGTGRGTFYFLHGNPPNGGDLFAMAPANARSSSVHSAPSSVHSEDADCPSPEAMKRLQEIAQSSVTKKRISPKAMETAIRSLCTEHWLSVKELSDLLDRTYDTIRIHYLNPMVTRGDLVLRYPERPSHPRQRYRVPGGRADPS